jgi:hypothetical protein
MWTELMGIINLDSYMLDQVQIRCSAFVRYWWKKWEYNGTIHQLFISFKNRCEAEDVCTILLFSFVYLWK